METMPSGDGHRRSEVIPVDDRRSVDGSDGRLFPTANIVFLEMYLVHIVHISTNKRWATI